MTDVGNAPAAPGDVSTIDADHDLSYLILGFRAHRAQHLAEGSVADPAAELDHLRAALQAAVTLEFATLPPYLSALWSVKDDIGYVANSIRQVIQEEMLHMSLAANMLGSIGGHPQISNRAPSYPGPLPLGIHPELVVHLAALSPDTLATFLEIERPHHPGHHVSLNAERDLDTFHAAEETGHDEADFTIGEFYDQIVESFRRLQPDQTNKRQVTAPLASMVITTVDDVEKAVSRIQNEGEGSSGPADTGAYNLAHYYRFAEIIELKRLVQDPKTGDYAFVDPIPFDMAADVWPMAQVPEGGYQSASIVDAEVRRLLHGFDLAYSQLLDLLQAVWESDDGQAALWHAIDAMFGLEEWAKPLMQIPRPTGGGNYGPEFRYVPHEQREAVT